MSDKLMKGLFPTVNVKKTTVAACKASEIINQNSIWNFTL